jgi:enoyl-CoA hydratase
MSSDHVEIEPHGAITVMRLNRPPANALELEIVGEFEAAFDALMRDPPRAIVVTGTGDFFCGGLDLRVVPSYSPEQQRAFLTVLNRASGKLYGCPVPVVGGINGHAIAGGFVFTLATDYRVGPTGPAQFGLTEARVGIPFPAAAMAIVHGELAPQDVRYTMIYASLFGAEEARLRGMLDELQPPNAVLERALEVARDMATMPADGYRRIKRQARQAALDRIEEVNATGSDPMFEAWVSPEAPQASDSLLRRSGGT